MKQVIILICVIYLGTSCSHHSNSELAKQVFADTPTAVPIKPGIIDEASGIADSRINPGSLWIEQDSGNPPELALLGYNGVVSKKIYIKGVINRDWEDIELAKGPDANTYYIYMADIGDNFLEHDNYYIFRFPEPAASSDTITTYDKITFKYPDGSNNAEATLIDPGSKDIYIITKSNVKTNIYKLPYPQSTTAITEAILVGSLPLTIVTGAAISPDGQEVIVKTYPALYYWKKRGTQTIDQLLQQPYTELGYRLEIQGEAVGFKNDNSGFFTLSEKPSLASSVDLNFYKRN